MSFECFLSLVLDEKAFRYVAEAGLVLVPFREESANGLSKVQILDVGETNLQMRGVIEHFGTARRAAFLDNHVVSISNQELITADISDRDQPVVKAELPLSWRTDRVFPVGNFLLQVELANGVNPELFG